jgi:alkanesulfonate monooxygenase SsuD/methylene tetrahydromethanopterin reductase-like flavin-dependent oxidoreductase (luciferase family)
MSSSVTTLKPAVSLAAAPGKRQQIIALAKEIDARGFPGIYCPSIGDGLALAEAVALVTEHVEIATAISPIYFRQAAEYAPTVSFIHEVSGGRFRFGIGVAHAPSLAPRGLDGGKPLADTRTFVEQLKSVPRVGALPPILLATLREKMIELAGEIGDGMIFANGARSNMQRSLAVLPAAKSSDPEFFIGNMIPTCIDNDLEAARAVNRKTLSRYALLPNYRNYWKSCGYEDEMNEVEACVASGKMDGIGACLSDRWLDDTTISGPPDRVRAELEHWFAAGIKTPILVPSSASGGQITAFEELFRAFA